jgi:hypothetical protein
VLRIIYLWTLLSYGMWHFVQTKTVEAAGSSRFLAIICQTVLHHILEDSNLHSHYCENLRYFILYIFAFYILWHLFETPSTIASRVCCHFNGIGHYGIVRNILDSVFNVCPVLILWWEIQTFWTQDFSFIRLPTQGMKSGSYSRWTLIVGI